MAALGVGLEVVLAGGGGRGRRKLEGFSSLLFQGVRGEDRRAALLGGGEFMGLALGTKGDGGFHSFF